MKVLIAGASGAVGSPLIEQLRSAGHHVTALSRHPKPHADIDTVACDALDAAALNKAVTGAAPDVIVNQLTALPPRLNPRRIGAMLAATNRLRTEGARNVMAAAQAAGVSRVIAQSIAFAYAPGSPALKTEDDPLYLNGPGEFATAAAAVTELERATLNTDGVAGTVLRYGYFYGPRTHYARDGSIAHDVIRRRFPIVGDGGGIFSFIHVEDAASAAISAIDAGATGTFNVVDDEPAPVREWLPVYAQLLQANPPRRVPIWLARLIAGPYGAFVMTEQRGADNARAKRELAWTPRFASWREGWARDLAAT
jgi:nucleoside-diphosphate-sugar epimerase